MTRCVCCGHDSKDGTVTINKARAREGLPPIEWPVVLVNPEHYGPLTRRERVSAWARRALDRLVDVI